MNAAKAIIGLLFLAVVTPLSQGALPAAAENTTVTVFAAAGTITPIRRIAAAYEEKTGNKVLTNFGSSSTLAQQIAAGADFDLYISANSNWMNFVEEKNRVNPGSKREFLGDRLVLIAPAETRMDDASQTIEHLLLQSTGAVAIGDPVHVPAGMYAKEALQAMGCWTGIQERLVPSPTVRAVQQLVETGQCPLGIVYRAGAAQSQKVKIIGLFDETLHTPVRFSVAAASNSINGETLLAFLSLPEAQQIFTNAGFSTLTDRNSSFPKDNDASSSPSAFNVNEWQALSISVKVAAVCVLAVAAPGIMLGYILACKSFPGRSLVNAFVHVPMVIPPVVTGYLALIFLGKNSLLGGLLYQTWGVSFAFNQAGAVLVAAVMGFPLLVRSVKTAVEMVDYRYRDAAHTLGSGPVRTFFRITLPLAGPGILAGLVLAFARSLGEFGATAVFVGNIPGKTQTLSLAIYNCMQIPGAESSAMRLVVVSIIISFAAMLGSEVLLQRMSRFGRIRS